jgi:3-hydroxyacyl-[acyl-carrier-protein] dehydratase
MPPTPLIDLGSIDLNHVIHDQQAIEKINPHRYEMQQLNGIVYQDIEEGLVVGYKEVTENEFWIRGHIPGRPLMPGVIMIEAAAQLASFFVKILRQGEDRFIGFGGIGDTKFRGTVSPGCRLYIVEKLLENRPRRFICAAQGYVNRQMVFETVIIGMPV